MYLFRDMKLWWLHAFDTSNVIENTHKLWWYILYMNMMVSKVFQKMTDGELIQIIKFWSTVWKVVNNYYYMLCGWVPLFCFEVGTSLVILSTTCRCEQLRHTSVLALCSLSSICSIYYYYLLSTFYLLLFVKFNKMYLVNSTIFVIWFHVALLWTSGLEHHGSCCCSLNSLNNLYVEIKLKSV